MYGEPTAGGLVLVGIPDAEWGCRVVAVTTGPHTTDEVRSALSRTLEAAALPREVRRVDSIPLTAGGKIDSQAVIEGWR